MQILKRIKNEKIKIKDLFNNLEIPDTENSKLEIKFPLRVNTPYGYKQIITAFRTENQQSVTSYFGNNTTIKTSGKHRFRTITGEWKCVDDITPDDRIETESSSTYIKNKKYGNSEVLYDISVEDVHCYYSNGILSHNSWVLCKLGAEAMKAGKNVLHVTLELNESYVGLRYDSIFTKIDFQEIRKHQDEVRRKLSEIDGKLVIKYYPIKTIPALTIKNHIERIQTLGKKIDLMIVDYADILRPLDSPRNSNSYHDAGSIYEELRGIAGELQIPCWSASQVGRCLSLQTIVTEEVMGDIEIGKLKVGDKILTHSGFKSVTKIFPIEEKPSYKIKLKNGIEIICSKEHKFPTKHGKLKSIEDGLEIGTKLFVKK